MLKYLYRMNLVQKLVVFFLLLIVIPILLAYWVVSLRVASITENQMGETLYQLAKTSHLTLDRDITSVDGTTEKLMFAPEMQQMFNQNSDNEFDRLQNYLALDKLLANYSKTIVNYSVFIPELAGDYPFAPDPDVKQNGVFFACDTSSSSWFQLAVNARGSGVIRVMNQLGNNQPIIKTAAFLRGVNSYVSDNTPTGVLVMTGLDLLLEKDLESVKIPKNGQIILLSRSGTILANTAGLEVGAPFPLPPSLLPSTEGVHIDKDGKQSWLYAIHNSNGSDTRLLFKIPIKSIIGEHEAMRQLVNSLMIVYFGILLVTSISFIRHIISPLSRLARLTRSFEPGRPLAIEIRSGRKDEIGMLNHAFVEMTKRLNQTIHDKYDLEIRHKEAELAMLHTQINPHLLYNTLESIYWRITAEGKSDSAEMIRDLSLLMRIGLSRGKMLIPIAEEIAHAEAYLRLQQKRYNYSFGIEWEIDEESRMCLIPKVVLQPLLENAIVHGIRNMSSEGELHIGIQMSEGLVRIEVEDNGYKPVDLAKMNDILAGSRPNEGYGIRNVDKRIKLHFGEHYGLSFELIPSGGTRAIVILPATREDS